MKLLAKGLNEVLSDLQKDRMHVSFWGDMDRISPDLQALCRKAESATRDFDVQVNFCLNYGGRDELVKATKAFAKDVEAGVHKPEDLTEALLSSYLYSKDIPDPELIIRPSGEQRISNFLLWQSAYSEFVFMDVLWPDFNPEHLEQAIDEYNRRNRRFGGV